MELPPTINSPEENLAKTPTTPPKDSQYAIACLITGILGWTLVPLLGSIAAIITGHLARKEIKESGGALGGNSMATAGLIMGYIQLGFVVLSALIILSLILVAGANWMA
jgi:hypothetical protein